MSFKLWWKKLKPWIKGLVIGGLFLILFDILIFLSHYNIYYPYYGMKEVSREVGGSFIWQLVFPLMGALLGFVLSTELLRKRIVLKSVIIGFLLGLFWSYYAMAVDLLCIFNYGTFLETTCEFFIEIPFYILCPLGAPCVGESGLATLFGSILFAPFFGMIIGLILGFIVLRITKKK